MDEANAPHFKSPFQILGSSAEVVERGGDVRAALERDEPRASFMTDEQIEELTAVTETVAYISTP